MSEILDTELVALDALTPHPRNYRSHPAEQQAHIAASIREHGIYRPIVVARDGTILAGHGVVEAARAEGIERLPVVRLDLHADDPRAIKLLVGDNEQPRLADDDGAQLAELLRSIGDDDWLGTGFDEGAYAQLLAGLGAATDPDAWSGMPEFEADDRNSAYHCTVHFQSPEDAALFFQTLDRPQAASFWWPEGDGHVGSSLHERYVQAES